MNWTFIDEQSESGEQTQENSPAQLFRGINPSSENEFEREIEEGSREAAKGLISGATLGISKNIPTMTPKEGKLTDVAEFTGSLLPTTTLLKLFGGPLANLASKSKIFKKQLSSLGNIVGAGLAGAATKGIEEIGKGEIPDTDEVLEHGIQWMALDAALQSAGLLGRFSSNLLKKSKAGGKAPFKILNETIEKLPKNSKNSAEKAMEILGKEPAISLKDLKESKIEPQVFDRLKTETFPEPFQPLEFKFEEITIDMSKSFDESVLDQISTRAESEKVFGENIQKDIEASFEKAKKTYEPIYEWVAEKTPNVKADPKKSLFVAESILKDINSLKTKPEGYQRVINSIENAIEDLGIASVSNKGFEGMKIKEKVPLNKLMELGRRLNKIIDYDIIGPSIKDKLKPLIKAVKQDIRSALNEVNPNYAKAFNEAELNYGKVAEKFGAENVRKIRGEELPERIAGVLNYPTAIQNLKSVSSPQQIAQIEREILSRMKEMSPIKSKEYFRNTSSQLSPQSKKMAAEIIESKKPVPSSGINQKSIKRIEQGVLEDLNNSINTGKRPEKALKLMKTEKGQKIIDTSMKNNPNGKEITKYLRDQTLSDFSKSIVDKNGKIDFKKLKEFLSDPATIENIKKLGGDQAVSFIKNLEGMSKSLERNFKLLESLPPKQEVTLFGKERLKKMARTEMPLKFQFEDFVENLGIPTKTVLGVTGALALGMPKTLATGAALKALYKLFTNRKAQIAFTNASKNRINPSLMLRYIDQFDDLMNEEEVQKEIPKEKWQFI